MCHSILNYMVDNSCFSWIWWPMDLYWQDDSDNITRFLVLAREPILPGTDRPFKVIAEITGLNASYVTLVFWFYAYWHQYWILLLIVVLNSQTSIVFSLEEGPGVLFKALAVFALRQINLSKVSCLLDVSWYIFYGGYICMYAFFVFLIVQLIISSYRLKVVLCESNL